MTEEDAIPPEKLKRAKRRDGWKKDRFRLKKFFQMKWREIVGRTDVTSVEDQKERHLRYIEWRSFIERNSSIFFRTFSKHGRREQFDNTYGTRAYRSRVKQILKKASGEETPNFPRRKGWMD